MKKYTTFVENKKGEQKNISMWVDDETARAIDEANDPEITRWYITASIFKRQTASEIFLTLYQTERLEILESDNFAEDSEQ